MTYKTPDREESSSNFFYIFIDKQIYFIIFFKDKTLDKDDE